MSPNISSVSAHVSTERWSTTASQPGLKRGTWQTGKDLYLRLLRYVFPYWKVFAASLLGTVAFAATEPAMPALLKPLLDETFVSKNPEGLVRLPLLLMLLFIVRGAASFVSSYCIKWVSTRVVMDLRKEMFDRLQTLPASYFENHASGNIISKFSYQRTTGDVRRNRCRDHGRQGQPDHCRLAGIRPVPELATLTGVPS